MLQRHKDYIYLIDFDNLNDKLGLSCAKLRLAFCKVQVGFKISVRSLAQDAKLPF